MMMMTTTTSTTLVPLLKTNSLNAEHLFDERYPKTSFDATAFKISNSCRIQSVLLPEINETDEDTQVETEDHQRSSSKVFVDYNPLRNLNIYRVIRKKSPFLQQLKTTREEPCETDVD